MINLNNYINEKLKINKNQEYNNKVNDLSELINKYDLSIELGRYNNDKSYKIVFNNKNDFDKIIQKIKDITEDSIENFSKKIKFKYDYLNVYHDKTHKYVEIYFKGQDSKQILFDYYITFSYGNYFKGIIINNNQGKIKCEQFDNYLDSYFSKLIEYIIE